MRVKIEDKVIPASFLKVEGRGTLVGVKKPEKEGWLLELVGDQKSGPEVPPWSKIGQERREQRRCQGRSNCQRSDKEE